MQTTFEVLFHSQKLVIGILLFKLTRRIFVYYFENSKYMIVLSSHLKIVVLIGR